MIGERVIWYFEFDEESGVVELRAPMEGDGIIGDARSIVNPGDNFFGLSFDDLVRAGAGTVVVIDKVASIQ
jgi:hypothetical protein